MNPADWYGTRIPVSGHSPQASGAVGSRHCTEPSYRETLPTIDSEQSQETSGSKSEACPSFAESEQDWPDLASESTRQRQ